MRAKRVRFILRVRWNASAAGRVSGETAKLQKRFPIAMSCRTAVRFPCAPWWLDLVRPVCLPR